MTYERPTLEVARSRYSVTMETHNDIGEAFSHPYAALRRNHEIIAYHGGWGPAYSANQCACEDAERRAKLDAGILGEPDYPNGLFKGPEDY